MLYASIALIPEYSNNELGIFLVNDNLESFKTLARIQIAFENGDTTLLNLVLNCDNNSITDSIFVI